MVIDTIKMKKAFRKEINAKSIRRALKEGNTNVERLDSQIEMQVLNAFMRINHVAEDYKRLKRKGLL